GGIHGALVDAAYPGFEQMMLAAPHDHPFFIENDDTNRDGAISRDEFAADAILENILAPDVQLFTDGSWQPRPFNGDRDSLSFGFASHATPCAAGRCSTAQVADHCDDRLLDSDETDVDCGGSCKPCPAAAACKAAADCQAPGCVGGRCAAPTCSD